MVYNVDMERRKYTYEELSALTGASVASISRVFTKSSGVSPKMREKIISKLEELGYERASFEDTKHPLIIFNIPALDNPFYSLIVQGAKDSAKRNHFDFLLYEDPLDQDMDSFISLIVNTQAVGVITTSSLSKESLLTLAKAVPVVQCCECIPELDIPFVTVNDRRAAKNAVRHLLSIGKKRIAFINGPRIYKYSKERLKGYSDALEEAGLAYDEELVLELPKIDYDMALSGASQLLNSPNRPDAFFASSDLCAIAVIKATTRLNLSVPTDVAVVGFDNVEISYMSTPAITTINQPRYQLGLLSTDMLTRMINGESMSVTKMWLETELIIRDSTLKR